MSGEKGMMHVREKGIMHVRGKGHDACYRKKA